MTAYLRYIQFPIALTSALAASLSGLLYWKQNELIYPRNVPPDARTNVPRPIDFPQYDFDDASEELRLPTPDGEHISAFLLKPRRRKAYKNHKVQDNTIIMFHGNAGNIGHRVDIAGCMQLTVPANILMVEYRGYGMSTGVPDENGLNIDAQTALDFVRQREDLKNSKIIVYGQSIGGAVAIQLAASNKHHGDIRGLILENTFLSVRKLIPTVFPPAKYLASLCHQYWNSEQVLPTLHPDLPILFLSGGQDEIVPPSMMRRLHAVCRSSIKIFRLFPQGDHNGTVSCHGYFEAVEHFLDKYVFLD